MRVNVLTPGFTTSNGSAFLHPLVAHNNALADAGFHVKTVSPGANNITECDALAIDSKAFRSGWASGSGRTLDLLGGYRDSVERMLWFDTTDSTGTLQDKVFPLVDLYCKSQLLADRSRYTRPMYGSRPHSDYYHVTNGVEDDSPETSTPIPEEYLGKLRVSWNSGLSIYTVFSPIRMALYRRVPWFRLIRYPTAMIDPGSSRSNDVSARFGTSYDRASLRYQREQISKSLATRMSTEKSGRRAYMKELVNSKIVVSPFGLGEITLKDFEVFLTGGMLFKPNMDHMETWPSFWVTDESYLSHSWSLDDFSEKLEWALSNESRRVEIAKQGQVVYRKYLSSPGAAGLFVEHFKSLMVDNGPTAEDGDTREIAQ